MLHTKFVEKIKKTFYVRYFFFENHVFCDIMWKFFLESRRGHRWKYGARACHTSN